MLQRLQLTAEERKWNSYYTTRNPDGSYRLGVQPRHYTQTKFLSLASPQASTIHFASKRARVWCITWSGDVYGLRVQPQTSTGELFCDEPTHIPLLMGCSPHSTATVSAQVPPYPSLVAPGDIAVHQETRWWWILEPNLVLPGDKQLILNYSLENPTDPALAQGGQYKIVQVVHQWEFPGYQGGPV